MIDLYDEVDREVPLKGGGLARAHVLRRLGEIVGPGGLVQKGRRLIAIGNRR